MPNEGEPDPGYQTASTAGSPARPLSAGSGAGAGESPGDTIGPYRLLEIVGEGGFGVVWLAERREPMVQRVALKIIKPGMDSKSVLARFEQERQALAVMDHPNVAKVLDGGVTPTGRPYFVMEHVKGEPITTFADHHRLTIKQRLELFICVCEAVQHAHMKGIIHRDIKPSNVLVAHAGEGHAHVVKVIDFGVAKAISHTLTDKTIFTERGQIIGTPEYMSPEQAEMGATDIDTRTDVYSLGVVLYELLSGTLPFDAKTLRSAGYAEIQRIIREVDAPRPSTRLSASDDETGTAIARARQADREKIAGELRRELEWIPMKALRKDRTRRYASAESLGADVRRYLDGQPLEAAPESRAYLVRKFVRRNRVQVLAAGAVALALAAGFGTALWQAREATRQAQRADERALAAEQAEAAATAARDAEKERADQLKQVSDFQSQMLGKIDTTAAGIGLMNDVRERFAAALAKAGVPEADRAAQEETLGNLLVRVNATDTAAAMIDRTILQPAIKSIDERFQNDPKTDASLRQALATLYQSIGLYDAALPLQDSALTTRRRALGENHPDTLVAVSEMGTLLHAQGKRDAAEPYLREAMTQRRRALGEEHPSTLSSISNMGSFLSAQGKFSEAEAHHRDALEKRRRTLGEEHPDTLDSINSMGEVLLGRGKRVEAEQWFRDALEKRRGVLGEEHPDTLISLNNLGSVLEAQGKFVEAEPYWREALDKSRRTMGEDHPNTIAFLNNVSTLLYTQGKLTEAEPYFFETLEKRRRVLGEEHPGTLQSINNIAILLRAQGRLTEAEPYGREAMEKRRRVLGEEHPDTLTSIHNMGFLLQAQNRLPEAEAYYLEALAKRRRTLGEEHPDTLNSIRSLGVLLRDQGRLAEAEPYYREAIELRRRALGEEHPETLTSIASMGALLEAQGKRRDAIELLAPYELAARNAFTGGNSRRLASVLAILGRARLGLGYDRERFALAEANLLEAHPIYVAAKDRGPTHKDTLDCAQGLFDLYTAWDAAEPESGYGAKAREWKAKLDPASTPTPDPAR